MLLKKTSACLAALCLTGGCSSATIGEWNALFSKNGTDAGPDGRVVSDAPPPQINPETHVASGQMLERQGDYDGAIEQYQKAVKANPQSIDAYNRLGKACCRARRYDAAEAAFRKGLDLKPDSLPLRNNLGYTYMAARRYDAAEKLFRGVLSADPTFERARINLGIVLARQRKLADATREFAKAVSTETAYYNVGVICAEMGDKAQARKAFKKSLAANPGYKPARKKLASLDANSRKSRKSVTPRIVSPPSAVKGHDPKPSKPILIAGELNGDAPSP